MHRTMEITQCVFEPILLKMSNISIKSQNNQNLTVAYDLKGKNPDVYKHAPTFNHQVRVNDESRTWSVHSASRASSWGPE
jgi:hypothetical protein